MILNSKPMNYNTAKTKPRLGNRGLFAETGWLEASIAVVRGTEVGVGRRRLFEAGRFWFRLEAGGFSLRCLLRSLEVGVSNLLCRLFPSRVRGVLNYGR